MLFYDIAEKYLAEDAENLAPLTIETYRWNLHKIQKFAPQLQCEELTIEFVRKYRSHLVELRNKENTINKALTVLRLFCKRCHEDGLIERNPFEKIKIHRVYTTRGFLTIKELRLLYFLFIDNPKVLSDTERETMRVFLFSCFTGLRYSDLKSLTQNEIFDYKIRKKTHKTGELVYIPIPTQARFLINQLGNLPYDESIFKVTDNSHFNKCLRRAAQKLGFHKHLHCHLARHTFATTCITLGIPLPATSKLLGHRNLDTTLIYAKYVDTFLDKEMAKFNRLR